VITRLWTGQPVSYPGRHYTLDNAVALPRPVQEPMPLLVGGHGGPRSVALGVRHATEYNTTSVDPQGAAETFAKVRAGCELAGRDPASLRLSWMGTVVIAADEAGLRRRMERAAAWTGDASTPPDDLRRGMARTGVVGTYDEAAETLRAYVDAGAERIYARPWDLADVDQISEIAEELWPRATR
jgi:alkanesulfonate monooxygenase SsuD/methylene tetrahydromethanopterin reductase-like flavin-dependent oxidoreductase (luciferase family)